MEKISWGFGGFYVGNLYSNISPYPKNIDSINQFRNILNKTLISFDSISKYRSVRVVVDVDPL